MPVVLRERGFAVHIFLPPREHPPPHVHVRRGRNWEVVIRLSLGPEPPALLRALTGRSRRHAWMAYQVVERHNDYLLQVWRALHGTTQAGA